MGGVVGGTLELVDMGTGDNKGELGGGGGMGPLLAISMAKLSVTTSIRRSYADFRF